MTIQFHIVNCTKLHNCTPHEYSACTPSLYSIECPYTNIFEEVDFMRLSLRLIYEQLAEQYPALSLMGSSSPGLTEVQIFSAGSIPPRNDVLYVVLDDAAPPRIFSETPGISCITRGPGHLNFSEHAIVVPCQYCMTDLFNDVVSLFRQFQSWETSVLDAIARERPLTDILNLSHMVTRDTVYLADTTLKLIAHTSPTLMDDISANWNYQIKYGYMPMNIVRKLIDTGELAYMNKTREAFTYPTETFNLPYTCKNIFHGCQLLAHLFIVGVYSPPTRTHLEIAEALGRMLSIYLEKNPGNVTLFGTFHEGFLRDILNRRLCNRDLIQNQLSYFDWKIDDTFALLLIDCAEDSQYKKQLIINHLSQNPNLDCSVFEAEHYLAAIYHAPDTTDIRRDLYSFADKFQIRGALSKSFHDLTNLHIYFEQAKKTLTIGQKLSPDNHIFINDDYGIYSIISRIVEGHSIFELCHEGVLRLYETDQENGTDYINTLFQYLSNDRNLLRTSKSLFIHRNTLSYRLDKISAVVDLEYDNPENRHYILMSLYILRYCILNRNDP